MKSFSYQKVCNYFCKKDSQNLQPTIHQKEISKVNRDSLGVGNSILTWHPIAAILKLHQRLQTLIHVRCIAYKIPTKVGNSFACIAFKDPADENFKPSMIVKCCRVFNTIYQAVPSTSPWQWARLKIARMHCIFLAVTCRQETRNSRNLCDLWKKCLAGFW